MITTKQKIMSLLESVQEMRESGDTDTRYIIKKLEEILETIGEIEII